VQTVKELKAWRIAAPDGCALANRDGGHEPYFRRTAVVAKDNQDRIGLAEIPGILGMDELINSPRVQALVVGKPAIQLRSIVDELDGLVGGDEGSDRGDKTWDADLGRHLKSGVEVSVGDLLAQREGVPLADLFGKRRRAACPVNAYGFWHFDPDGTGIAYLPPDGLQGWDFWKASPAMDIASLVKLFGALLEFTGAKSLKLKAGVFDPETETNAMLALKEAYPRIRLTLDPNACWDVPTSIRVLTRLKGIIDYIEDPTWGIENLTAVQQVVAMRIATNMAVTRFKHLKPALQAGLDLIVLADPQFWGGISSALAVARFCAGSGWGLGCHSNNHQGIAMMTTATLGVLVEDKVLYDFDTHYPYSRPRYEVVDNPPVIRDGAVEVSGTPGLGLRLNWDKLAAAHKLALSLPNQSRDDRVFMERKYPGWKPNPRQWALKGYETYPHHLG
jgi:glucarate dehydratase